MHKNCMPSFFKFGFSTKVTKKKAENIRERDERGALRKKQKLDNCIINIDDDDDINFGGLGVGGDTVEDGDNVPLLALPQYDYRIARCFFSNNLTSPATKVNIIIIINIDDTILQLLLLPQRLPLVSLPDISAFFFVTFVEKPNLKTDGM